MKKIITGILATLSCLALLSGCSFLPGFNNSSTPTESSSSVTTGVTLAQAKSFIRELYKDQNLETNEDYTLITKYAPNANDVFTITWSVDVPETSIKIVPVEGKDQVTVDLDNEANEDVSYTLKGVIANKDGEELEVEFYRTLKAVAQKVPYRITEAPKENVPYKYYVFNPQGKDHHDCYVNGEIPNTSNPWYLGTSESFEEGIDFYAEYVEGTDTFHLKTTIEGKTQYLNIVTSGTHTNTRYEDVKGPYPFKFNTDPNYKTITADVNGTTFYMGIDGTYTTLEAQKDIRDGYCIGYLCELIDRNDLPDAEKVDTESKALLSLQEAYVGTYELELPATGSSFSTVAIKWTVEGEGAKIENGKLKLTAGTAITEFTLKAEIKLNEAVKAVEMKAKLVPNTETAILEAGAALSKSGSFGNEVELTGVITRDADVWTSDSGSNSNATFRIAVGGRTLGAYRINGSQAVLFEDLVAGAKVTIKGFLAKYNGTLQFAQGSVATKIEKGGVYTEPYTTAEQIFNAATALADGETLDSYTLEGVVSNIADPYDAENGNMNLTINVGDLAFYCYRLTGSACSIVKVGDTITVTGNVMNYNGTIQFGSGCKITAHKPGTSTEEPGDIEDNGTTVSASIEAIAKANNWENSTAYDSFTLGENVTVSASGTAVGEYALNTGKFYTNGNNWRLYQTENGTVTITATQGKKIVSVKITYLSEKNGVLAFGTTEIASDSIVTVNARSVSFTVVNGTDNKGQARITAIEVTYGTADASTPATPPTVEVEGGTDTTPEGAVTGKDAVDALYALAVDQSVTGTYTITGKITALDSYNNPTIVMDGDTRTVYCYKLVNDKFVVGATITVTATTLKNYGGTYEMMNCTLVGEIILPGEGGNEGDNPTQSTATIVTSPVVGTAYKIGMVQENLKKTYYLAGGMGGYNNYYLATTDDASKAIDLYLETTEGGYYIYCMVDNVKTYLNCVISGEHVNGAYEATASTVWTYNSNNVLVTTVNNAEYALGTRNDKDYDTIGPVKVSYNGFHCHLYTSAPNQGGTTTPGEGDNEGETGIEATNAAVLDALYALQAGEKKTGTFTVTGKITALDSFNNPTIVLNNDTARPIYCYYLTDSRFVVGATITITGTELENYNGKYEIKYSSVSKVILPDGTEATPEAAIVGKDAVDALYALAVDQSVTGTYTITGKITALDSYTNPTIVMEGDTRAVFCYRLKNDNFVIGATITVTATTLKNYGGTYEMMNCTLVGEIILPEGGNEGGNEGEGETPDTPATPVAGIPANLVFTGLVNKASADAYMKEHYADWTITGKLGNGYGDYLGFGRSGDATSAITSTAISTEKGFTLKVVLKGNAGNDGVVTSKLVFTLVDKDGNVVATGYANGTSDIVPTDGVDTTYTITFTFVEGKSWADVANLKIDFTKATGNIGMKSLEFIVNE